MIYMYMYVCIYMRDEKEERKKEASKVKQTNKAKQYMYMVERSVWSAECVMGSNSFRRKRTSLNAVCMALLASFFLPFFTSLINTCIHLKALQLLGDHLLSTSKER